MTQADRPDRPPWAADRQTVAVRHRDAVPRRLSLRRALLAALMVVAAVVLGSAAPAAAHAALVTSTPAPQARLSEPPTEIVLTFDEPVEATLGGHPSLRRDRAADRRRRGPSSPGRRHCSCGRRSRRTSLTACSSSPGAPPPRTAIRCRAPSPSRSARRRPPTRVVSSPGSWPARATTARSARSSRWLASSGTSAWRCSSEASPSSPSPGPPVLLDRGRAGCCGSAGAWRSSARSACSSCRVPTRPPAPSAPRFDTGLWRDVAETRTGRAGLVRLAAAAAAVVARRPRAEGADRVVAGRRGDHDRGPGLLGGLRRPRRHGSVAPGRPPARRVPRRGRRRLVGWPGLPGLRRPAATPARSGEAGRRRGGDQCAGARRRRPRRRDPGRPPVLLPGLRRGRGRRRDRRRPGVAPRRELGRARGTPTTAGSWCSRRHWSRRWWWRRPSLVASSAVGGRPPDSSGAWSSARSRSLSPSSV